MEAGSHETAHDMKFLYDALGDIGSALGKRRIWFALASEDISDQHRRTSLGPFWLLINYLVFVATFVFIMGRGEGIPNYTAYVALGLLVWFYIMETMNSGVGLFVREESFIKGTTLPLSLYVFRMTMQALMRAGYAALGCAVLLAVSGVDLSWSWLWSAAAIALIVFVTPAAIMIFAFLGAYFPDSQFIVQNLTRVACSSPPCFGRIPLRPRSACAASSITGTRSPISSRSCACRSSRATRRCVRLRSASPFPARRGSWRCSCSDGCAAKWSSCCERGSGFAETL